MEARSRPARPALPLAALLFSSLFFFPGALRAVDLIRAGSASARAGARAVPVTIEASNDLPIQGFSVSLWFDPALLAVADATYGGTVVEALSPEYFDSSIDPAGGNIAAAVVFELSAPYELVSLDPSPDTPRPILTVLFDVLDGAVPGAAPLSLANSPGEHPIRNIFTDMGTTILPALEDGSFIVLPREFRRAYVNADLRVDLSDAIFLLSFIFMGGAAPSCEAAADVNGDRRRDLSDAIWLLAYIFQGGRRPPDPFFECGDDPGGAALPCAGQPVCP